MESRKIEIWILKLKQTHGALKSNSNVHFARFHPEILILIPTGFRELEGCISRIFVWVERVNIDARAKRTNASAKKESLTRPTREREKDITSEVTSTGEWLVTIAYTAVKSARGDLTSVSTKPPVHCLIPALFRSFRARLARFRSARVRHFHSKYPHLPRHTLSIN